MTACLEAMGFDIFFRGGVKPAAYNDFVEYNVQALDPANSEIGATYAETLSQATRYVALLIIVIVLFAFIILIALALHSGYITEVSAIAAIAMAAIISVLYYILVRSYSLASSYDVVPAFQQSLVKSSLYTLNASIRDTIYLALCK